jgi:hypothetical protein
LLSAHDRYFPPAGRVRIYALFSIAIDVRKIRRALERPQESAER